MASPTYDSGPYVGVDDEDLKPVSIADYAKQAWNDNRHVSVMSARALNLSEAFDEVNDKIAKATGAKDLANPLQAEAGLFQPVKRPEQAPAPSSASAQPLDVWKARVRELQKAHPDALPWDEIIDEPGRKALERMKSVREATSALDDRAGMAPAVQHPSLGVLDYVYSPSEQFVKNMIRRPDLAVAGLGAGFAASMTSPVDAALNLIGATWGGKSASLAKNAFLNAAANTIGQAPLSAFKQPQYKEAGLPYGWDVWTREVAGAGVAGGLIDVSVRGPARAIKGLTGHTEGLGGVITDAPRAIPLPEQPKVRPDIPAELIERARADDLEALKEIARLSGVDEDPTVKGAIHYAETTGPVDEAIAQRFRVLGVDDGEGLRVLADALRGDARYVRPPEPVAPAEPRMRDEGARLITEREPELQALITGLDQRLQQRIVDAVEAGIPRVVNLVQERLDAAKGKDAGEARASLISALDQAAEDLGGPERFAAMVDLYSGRGDIRTTAEAIRNFPDLVDADLAGSGLIQGARSIAKLEPEAFERFRSGDVSPGVARVVSDMVPPDQQARVIDDMRRAGIETETDARGVVGDLVKPSRGASDADAPLSRGSKIDDPAGAEAAKQTEILANELGEALKEAQAPIKARDKLETQMDAKLGEIAKIEEKAAKKAAKAEAAKDIPEHLFAMTADEVDAKPKPKGARQKIRLEGGPLSEAEGSVARGRLKHFAQSVIDQYETWREAGGDAEYRQMLLDQRREDNEQNLKDYSGVPFHYDIIGPDGKAVGSGVEGVVLGRTMVIDWIGGYGHENSLGIRVLKQLREQVRKDFPKVDTFAGYRVSGARAAAEAEDRRQVVKLFALSEEDIAAIGEKHAEYRDLQAQHREAMRGSPLFSLVMDRAAQQRSRDVGQAISVALRTADQILPSDVKVDVRTDEMRDPTTGNRLEATSNTRTGDIELAAYALNPAARLGHEAVHTLVTRGLLSPEEVSLLAKAAREAGAFTKEADYREAYKARADLDRLIEEEAAAHYLEAVIARRVEPTIPRNLVEKIHQIIERIRNALNGYGFRTETDVVRAIMEGDAAARRSVLAWMRSADMGAVAVDKAKGRMFALAGEKAQTANLDALARAKELEASGMDRDNIWTLTGWGRGADGKWRFEIDDSDAGFSARQSVRRESGQMDQRFEHPDLYEAYPALRALDLVWDRNMDARTQLGGFDPNTGVVTLAANTPSQMTLPVMLHELQHGVQEMERFARGGSMAEFEVAPARVQGWLQGEDAQFIKGTYFERDITMSAAKVIDGFDGGDLEQLRGQVMQLVQRGDISLDEASAKIARQMQADGYTRLAGEVEARLAETRMDMTPEQRRERPFWYDYDVLEMEQDVRRRDVLFAMAGEKAKTAPLSSRNLAESMERKGRDPDYILKNTGWFRGPDQKWRFEIDDSQAKIINLDQKVTTPKAGFWRSLTAKRAPGVPSWAGKGVQIGLNIKIPEILSHEKLFEAYPMLRNMRVSIIMGKGVPEGKEGGAFIYKEEGGKILYSPIQVKARDKANILPYLMHEIQHYIQKKEGFQGGSASSGRKGDFDTLRLDYNAAPSRQMRFGNEQFSTTTFRSQQDAMGYNERPDWRSHIAGMNAAEQTALAIADLWDALDKAPSMRGLISINPETRGFLANKFIVYEDLPRKKADKIDEAALREHILPALQADLMSKLRVTAEDYLGSLGEAEANAVMDRLKYTPEQRRNMLPKMPKGANAGQVTPDFREAAQAVLDSARKTQAIREKWMMDPVDLGDGVSVQRWRENSLSFSRDEAFDRGAEVAAELDFENGRAIVYFLKHALDGYKVGTKGGYAPLTNAEMTLLADKADAYVRSMNLLPTADIRLKTEFMDIPQERLSEREIAFWKNRDPFFLSADETKSVPRDIMQWIWGLDEGELHRTIGPELTSHIIEARNVPRSEAEQVSQRILDATQEAIHGEATIAAAHKSLIEDARMALLLKAADLERVDDFTGLLNLHHRNALAKEAADRAAAGLIELPMPVDYVTAKLDPEQWRIRDREAHQEPEGTPTGVWEGHKLRNDVKAHAIVYEDNGAWHGGVSGVHLPSMRGTLQTSPPLRSMNDAKVWVERALSDNGMGFEKNGNAMFAMSDEPRIPLRDDMEAIARYDAIKQLAEACK